VSLKVGQSTPNYIIAACIKEFHKQVAPIYRQGRAGDKQSNELMLKFVSQMWRKLFRAVWRTNALVVS
jgi:hypothetical protein